VKCLSFTRELLKLPKSLLLIAGNRFSHTQLDLFLSLPKSASIDPRPHFVFGADMFPVYISLVTGQDNSKYRDSLGLIAKSMTLGTLRGFRRQKFQGENCPCLAYSTQNDTEKVHGMLVFGLDDSQRR